MLTRRKEARVFIPEHFCVTRTEIFFYECAHRILQKQAWHRHVYNVSVAQQGKSCQNRVKILELPNMHLFPTAFDRFVLFGQV